MSKFLKKVANIFAIADIPTREDYGVAEKEGVCRKEFSITLGLYFVLGNRNWPTLNAQKASAVLRLRPKKPFFPVTWVPKARQGG